MRAALDEEVLHRARALAADGPDALLADLHERVRWERPVLTLVKPPEQHFSAVDQRLLLIPLIFSRGALACSTDDAEVVAVSYQARGAVLLADGTPAPAEPAAPATDRLAILVGRGRAGVLRALTRPATTAGLAATLGSPRAPSPSTSPRCSPPGWCTAAGSAGGCCTGWNPPVWPWSAWSARSR